MAKKFTGKLREIGNSKGIIIPSFIIDSNKLELDKEYEFKLVKKDGVNDGPVT